MIPKLSSIIVILMFMLSLGSSVNAFGQTNQKSNQYSGRTIGFHLIRLKKGVDPAEFERWVQEKFNPAFADVVPGFRFYIAKVDRGDASLAGQYMKFTVYDSRSARDFFFPHEGKPHEVNTAPIYKIWALVSNDYSKYVEEVGFVDYIEMR